MKKTKNAITLVEIIIVWTIISIISVVWLLYYNSYLVTVRDSSRLVELWNIETALWTYVLKNWFYPDPSNWVQVTYSWAEVWTQWTIWESVTNIISYSKDVHDPLTNNEYTYSVKNSRKEYSLAWVLEERPWLAINNRFIQTANAEAPWSKKWIALVKWNYNWEVVSIKLNWITNILALPSIVSSNLSSPDILDILSNHDLVYNDYWNIPASYSGSVFNFDANIDFAPNELVIFTWSVSNLKETYNQVWLLQDLYSAYSWSLLWKSISVNRIDYVDLFSPEPSSKTKVLACDLINFKLKYFVECWWVDFITFFVVNVLHIDITNLPWSKITVVYQDNDWNFVFWTNAWLAFYDWENWLVYNKQNSSLVHNYITSVTQDNTWNYWIWTQNWISKLVIWDFLNTNDDIWVTIWWNVLVWTHIQYIYTDSDWIVWIWTNQGVSSYNWDIWTSYTKQSSWLTHNNITAIFTDSQWHVWFWTNSKWIDKFSLSYNRCLEYWWDWHEDDGEYEDDDDFDNDWFEDDFDDDDNDNDWQNDEEDDDDDNDWQNDEEDDDDDNDWIHDENDGEHCDWNDHDDEEDLIDNFNTWKLPDHRVTYIFEDKTWKIWVWTQWWIWVSTNYWSTWTTYTNANTSWWLIWNYITYMFEDNVWNKRIWTTSWLSKFNWTTWTNYSTSNWMLWNYIFLIYKDSNWNIIIFSNWWVDTIDSNWNIIT